MPGNSASRRAGCRSAALAKIPRRSRRRFRYRDPASNWANRSRQRGCRSACRPANGFEGSAVWQLAQSAASAIALPRAMVSADGSARAPSNTDAVHKSTPAKNRSPDAMGSLHQFASLAVIIPRNSGGGSATSFRERLSRRYNRKTGVGCSGMKLRSGNAGLHCRDFGCARLRKATYTGF